MAKKTRFLFGRGLQAFGRTVQNRACHQHMLEAILQCQLPRLARLDEERVAELALALTGNNGATANHDPVHGSRYWVRHVRAAIAGHKLGGPGAIKAHQFKMGRGPVNSVETISDCCLIYYPICGLFEDRRRRERAWALGESPGRY